MSSTRMPALTILSLWLVAAATFSTRARLPLEMRGRDGSFSFSVNPNGTGLTVMSGPHTLYLDTAATAKDDFSAYRAANDRRIAEWGAYPSTAPAVDSLPVRVTFRSPKASAATLEFLGEIADQVTRYEGYRFYGSELSYFSGFDGLDPTEFADPDDRFERLHPICDHHPLDCAAIGGEGITGVQFTLQGGIETLAALRDHPDVYLADSTAIQAHAELMASHPLIAMNVQDYSFPNPDQVPGFFIR